MKTPNQIRLKVFTMLSLACLAIPLSIYVLWIYVFDLGTTQAERVAIYHTYFPEFFHGRWSTTLLSIVFCAGSIVFCSISLEHSQKAWKIINVSILAISCLLLALNVFSMM
jgi:MFS family permease